MILITGYEGYGGRSMNPSELVTKALHGETVAGHEVHGEVLPVDYAEIRSRLPELIDAHRPTAVLMLGLWPGEPMIRLERIAANSVEFEVPDNSGSLLSGEIDQDGPTAYRSTLPLGRIRTALRGEGIPCRISDTAGTFLCNALMYTALAHFARQTLNVPCGFIHLPYLPEQVAGLLDDLADAAQLELHQRADLASMDPDLMIRAVCTAIGETVAEAAA